MASRPSLPHIRNNPAAAASPMASVTAANPAVAFGNGPPSASRRFHLECSAHPVAAAVNTHSTAKNALFAAYDAIGPAPGDPLPPAAAFATKGKTMHSSSSNSPLASVSASPVVPDRHQSPHDFLPADSAKFVFVFIPPFSHIPPSRASLLSFPQSLGPLFPLASSPPHSTLPPIPLGSPPGGLRRGRVAPTHRT